MARPKPARRARARAYHHGDLRRTLIDTALALVAESDVSALTLREVARRAGVTHGAPYHHFPSKAALVAAVAEEGYRLLYAEQVESAARPGLDPIGRLRALGITYVRFALAHPGHFRVMFRMDVADWAASPTLAEAAQRTLVLLTGTVNEVIRTERLDADMMELTLAAWAAAHGLSTLWVDGPLRRSQAFSGEKSFESLVERVIAVSTDQLYRDKPRVKRRR